ncbi:hypothetical protein T492DRAFT_863013 [Pavlovales sp. CCMP2436]|nr:hypothetical protein T492DRAFT_863013 [Pavlovales sp. CCMP2436]
MGFTGLSAVAPDAMVHLALLAYKGGKGWSSGTCACSEIDSLCLACWCPCIQFGHN